MNECKFLHLSIQSIRYAEKKQVLTVRQQQIDLCGFAAHQLSISEILRRGRLYAIVRLKGGPGLGRGHEPAIDHHPEKG